MMDPLIEGLWWAAGAMLGLALVVVTAVRWGDAAGPETVALWTDCGQLRCWRCDRSTLRETALPALLCSAHLRRIQRERRPPHPHADEPCPREDDADGKPTTPARP